MTEVTEKKREESSWALAVFAIGLVFVVAAFVLGMNYLQILAAGVALGCR
jgi:hypothetical protein